MTDATDDFNRASLGSNWTNLQNTLTINASTTVQGSAAGENSAYWNLDTFNSDQYSQVTIVNDNDGGGPCVRMQVGVATYYEFYDSGDGTFTLVAEITSGSFAGIGASYAVNTVANDVLKLDVTGSTLTPTINGGGGLSTRSDSTITGGNPGIHIFSTAHRFDSWLGGAIASSPTTLTADGGTYTASGAIATDTFGLRALPAGA